MLSVMLKTVVNAQNLRLYAVNKLLKKLTKSQKLLKVFNNDFCIIIFYFNLI